jgi:hypothetical protein
MKLMRNHLQHSERSYGTFSQLEKQSHYTNYSEVQCL